MSDLIAPNVIAGRTFTMRSDFVMYRLIERGKVRGLDMPDSSAMSKRRIILAIGPKVEDLKVGDEIYCIGQVGQDLVPLPDDPHVFITRQANVILTINTPPELV